MFSWFLPCLFSFSGWCAGARIVRPVCFGLLWLSLCVRCLVVLVFSVWFLVVSRVPVDLLFLLLSFPRLLWSALLLVCGVASAWLTLSLLRSLAARPLS